MFRKIIFIFLDQKIDTRRSSYTRRLCLNCLYKTKAEVNRVVLRDIFQNFERADNLIKERIEDICERKKISAEEAFYFYILLVFLFSKHDVNLTLFMKNSCLLLLCK